MSSAVIGQRKAVDAISRYVRLNNIRVGEKLPSIRTIAGETGLATGTVARAIRMLSEEGILTAQNRSGTVLAKDICEESNNTVQRLIMLNCISNNNRTTNHTYRNYFKSQRYLSKIPK